MDDKTIDILPEGTSLDAESLLTTEKLGEARRVRGVNMPQNLTSTEFDMSVWEENQVTIFAVQGEAGSRFPIVNLKYPMQVRNQRDEIEIKLAPLDVTGCRIEFWTKYNDTEASSLGTVLDAENGRVQLEIIDAMCARAGDITNCEIRIIRDLDVLKAVGITLRVSQGISDDGAIGSNEYSALVQATNDCLAATSAAETAASAANTAADTVNTAVDNANSAASAANSAASAANSAATQANSARDDANDAADAANTATSAANAAASAANTAADRAGAIADDVDGVVNAAIEAFATNALSYKRDLGTDNLNTITEMGIYGQASTSSAATARNYPIATAGCLVVIAYDSTVYQFYVVQGYACIYLRRKPSTSWSTWEQIYPGVQSGGATNNRWIKYPDGTMIVTQKYSIDLSKATYSYWGANITEYYLTSVPPSFALAFTSVPFCTYSLDGNYSFWIANNTSVSDSSTTATHSARLSLLRPRDAAQATSGTVTVTVTAIGRWK